MRVIMRKLLGQSSVWCFHIFCYPVLLCIIGTNPWKICFLGLCLDNVFSSFYHCQLSSLPITESKTLLWEMRGISSTFYHLLPCRRWDTFELFLHWDEVFSSEYIPILYTPICIDHHHYWVTECLRGDQSLTCFCPCKSLILSQTSHLKASALQKCGIADWNLHYSSGWETTSWRVGCYPIEKIWTLTYWPKYTCPGT